MDEEVELIQMETEEKMQRSIKHLKSELARIRAGRANINMFDGIMVDYYGSPTPLNQVSNINAPDARTLAIQPWEKTLIDAIEKAIMAANLGITPQNNGEIIRINIPMLTEERRRDLVKQVKNEGENAKIAIRNIRRDSKDQLKKLLREGLSEDIQKDAEETLQEMTDQFIKEVDDIIEVKEKDIMTV
ncbi:MAG: ribosome recycling factor [Bacteroidales bacterium]|nr:ribosome recycling factor [Bacteroidales bacterium]